MFTDDQIAIMEEMMDEEGFSMLRTWIREQCVRGYVEGRGRHFPPSVSAGGYRERKPKHTNEQET